MTAMWTSRTGSVKSNGMLSTLAPTARALTRQLPSEH